MTERSVAIGFLSYSGQPHLTVMASLTDEINDIVRKTGWEVKIISRSGSGIIPHVRNSIVSDFLTTGCTDLIMMDDDNHPDPGGLLKILLPDVDVCGIPCRSRREELIWPVRWDIDIPIDRHEQHGLIEVESVGTGIIRITRNAVEKMIEADPDAWYQDKSAISGKSHELFKFGSRDHVYWGEDVHFCRRWRELGGKVWIHPDIITHHYGMRDHADSVGRWLTQGLSSIAYTDNGGHIKHPVDLVNGLSLELLAGKSVALVIVSRGNPDQLFKTIMGNLSGTFLTETKIVVGLDDDDPTLVQTQELLARFPPEAKVITVIGPRPDSIGEVYNRCVHEVQADLYINGADDVILKHKGWDARILQEATKFPDGIGTIGIGTMPVPSMLPVCSAVTAKLIEKMGFFHQPYTPYWWLDTWLFEISYMIGRQLPLDMEVEAVNLTRTRGMREIPYWAMFFDNMRPHRRKTAESIINGDDFKSTDGVKKMLLERMDGICAKLEKSNSVLRDEKHAEKIMQTFSHDAPDDERYKRIKARSLELLQQIAA